MISHCADTECEFYNPDGCTASEIHHTSDRFCTAGRRKPRDFTKELMDHFNSGCHRGGGKHKSNKIKLRK
jgi:hypothetical protein